MLLKVDCLPNAVGKQQSIPLIYLGRKWTLNWWWWWLLAHCCMCSTSRSRVRALDTKLQSSANLNISFPAVIGQKSGIGCRIGYEVHVHFSHSRLVWKPISSVSPNTCDLLAPPIQPSWHCAYLNVVIIIIIIIKDRKLLQCMQTVPDRSLGWHHWILYSVCVQSGNLVLFYFFFCKSFQF